MNKNLRKNKKSVQLLKDKLVKVWIGNIFFVLLLYFSSCNTREINLVDCPYNDIPFDSLPDTLKTIFLNKLLDNDWKPLNIDTTKMHYIPAARHGFFPGKEKFIINNKTYFKSITDYCCLPYVIYNGYLYHPCEQNLHSNLQIKGAKYRQISLK